MKDRHILPWSLLICIVLLASESLAAKATSLILKKSKPETKVNVSLTEEEAIIDPVNITLASNSTNTTLSKLTGVPQRDYIHDPNLPRELNGFNLTDYPFYNGIPEEIDFKCDGLHDGFYASVLHKCQVYHHCLFGTRYDFLCANYTAFDQRTFICHFASEVDCKNSPRYFNRNEALYKAATTTTTTTQAPVGSRRGQGDTAGGRKRRPHRRRKPMYEYYDDYEDYQGESDYYDDGPGHRARKRPRPQGGGGGGGGRDSHSEQDDYDEDKVPPSGPNKALYDRPRVAPKVRRPVPLNERDKYDYSSDSRVVSTSEAPDELKKGGNDSNSRSHEGSTSKNRGSDDNRDHNRERESDRDYERPLRDRRPQKKRRRPDGDSDYDDEEIRRPRPSYRDRPKYDDDYDYEERPPRNQHRSRDNDNYRSRDTEYERDRYYDRPINRDEYDRPRNRDTDRPRNRDDDSTPSRVREETSRPHRIRDEDVIPTRVRDAGDNERPLRNRDEDDKYKRTRNGEDRPSRTRDDDDRPSRIRDEKDKPTRNRHEGDRSKVRDENPAGGREKDESVRNRSRDATKSKKYDSLREDDYDEDNSRERDDEDGKIKNPFKVDEQTKNSERSNKSRENINKQKARDSEEEENRPQRASTEYKSDEQPRQSFRNRGKAKDEKNQRNPELPIKEEKRTKGIQRMRITTTTTTTTSTTTVTPKEEEKPVPAARPAYITKPETVKTDKKIERKIPVIKRPAYHEELKPTSAEGVNTKESALVDYYDDDIDDKYGTKSEEDTQTSNKKIETGNIREPILATVKNPRPFGPSTSKEQYGSSREELREDVKINEDKETILKVPLEEIKEDEELAPQAPKFQTVVRRRPFLPSRGGNPNLPRGLKTVGTSRIVEMKRPQSDERKLENYDQGPPASAELEQTTKQEENRNSYRKGTGIEFRTKVSASLGVEKPKLGSPVVSYQNPTLPILRDEYEPAPQLSGVDAEEDYSHLTEGNNKSSKKTIYPDTRPGLSSTDYYSSKEASADLAYDNTPSYSTDEGKLPAKTNKGTNINLRPTLKPTYFPSFVQHEPASTNSQASQPQGHYITKNPYILQQQNLRETVEPQNFGPQTFYSENPKFKTTSLSVGAHQEPKPTLSSFNTGTHLPITQSVRQIPIKDTQKLDNRPRFSELDNRPRFSEFEKNPSNSEIKFPTSNLADTDEYDISLNDALQPISTLHPRNVQTGVFISNNPRNVPVLPIKRKFQATYTPQEPVLARRQEYISPLPRIPSQRNEPSHKLVGQRPESSSINEKFVSPPFYTNIQPRPLGNYNQYFTMFSNK